MLENNLDPEVAERPDDLVVYGGHRTRGARLAQLRRARAHAHDAEGRRDDARPVADDRSACSRPTSGRRGSSSPTRTSCRDWATWPEFRRLEALGLTMYGQMTAGSWIYIGTQGILQGTYETFAAVAAKRLRRNARGHAHADERRGRHGRRPAARGHDERRSVPVRRRRPVAAATTGRPALPRRVDELTSMTPSRESSRAKRDRSRAQCGTARQRRDHPARATAPWCRGRHRDRSDLGARPAELPARGHRSRRLARLRRQEARRVHRSRARVDGSSRRGDGRLPRRAAPRSSTTATRCAARRSSGATRAPSPTPASSRRTFDRSSARARAPSAGPRCRATPGTSRRTDKSVLELFPDNEPLRRWITKAAGARGVPGTARTNLLARLRRTRQRGRRASTTSSRTVT